MDESKILKKQKKTLKKKLKRGNFSLEKSYDSISKNSLIKIGIGASILYSGDLPAPVYPCYPGPCTPPFMLCSAPGDAGGCCEGGVCDTSGTCKYICSAS